MSYITMRSLPIFGNHNLQDGLNAVAVFTDPIKKVTIENGYILVKENKIIAYGFQPHVWLWEDK